MWHRRGFTLIELLIVVAMIAILASVAFPSYSQYVKKSRRAEAQSYLMTVAARQQQFLVDSRQYSAQAPTQIVPQPQGVTSAYTVSIATADGPPPTFVITAAPVAAQASERCGTLSIDQTGTKSAASAECW